MTFNTIDTGLPNFPSHSDPATNGELIDIYNAIKILQQFLSDSTQFIALASEAISAGQYVALYNNAGVCNVRLAKAADNTKVAIAFATTNVSSGSHGVFKIVGNNTLLTGLSPGTMYYLSDATAGAVTATKPVGAGKIVQPIGQAITATELITNISLNFTQL